MYVTRTSLFILFYVCGCMLLIPSCDLYNTVIFLYITGYMLCISGLDTTVYFFRISRCMPFIPTCPLDITARAYLKE